MKFAYSLILLLTIISIDLYAGAMESEVKKDSEIKSKGVIKCHPDGKDGGLTPLKALQLLKPGMTLHLLPAEYWSTLEISQDRVIITSEGQTLHYSLRLKGRDPILKNIRCGGVTIENDAVIVDSVLGHLNIGTWSSDRRLKINAFLYNSAFNGINVPGGEHTISVELKNCLVKGQITNHPNTKMSITDSVLYSDGINFSFTDYDNKKGRLLLKNNLLYGKTGYARMEYSPNPKKNGVTVLSPKDIRKLWSVAMSGKHIHEAPKFQTEHQLFLAEDSPGKGRGLLSDEHPQFEIIKNQKDNDQGNHEDRERARREEREERRKRWAAERERRRRDQEERLARENEKDDDTEPADNGGNIGGVPKPPE